MSIVGERNEALTQGTGGGTSPGGVTFPVPESDVEFDSGDGHDHDGTESHLIAGTQVEIDFGSTPTRYKTAVVTDTVVVVGLQIIMVQAADAPTNKSQDENEMDPIICRAVAESGQFTAYLSALEGPVVGAYRFNYRILQTHIVET